MLSSFKLLDIFPSIEDSTLSFGVVILLKVLEYIMSSFFMVFIIKQIVLRLTGSEGLLRLKSVVSRSVKQGFLPPNQPAIDEICDKNDVGIFRAIMGDSNHVLNHLLPPVEHGVYNLRQRNHNRIILDIKD